MQRILLFDGVCNLCTGVVQFVIERDTQNKFRFASLQSEAGQAFLQKFRLPTQKFDSFILIEGDRYYTESRAALRLARQLPGAWSWLYGFIIVPKFIRDFVYRTVARNRYRWFGTQESCMIPTPELQARFLN